MRMLFLVFLCLAALTPASAYAQKKIKGRVTPMPPKVKSNPLDRMFAVSEVPDPLGAYTLTVNGEIDGQVYYPSAVPLYYLADYRSSAGTIPVGTEFKADFIRAVGGSHYYGMAEPESKEKNAFKPKVVKWIDGRFLKISKK